MKVAKKINSVRRAVESAKRQGRRVGFVPTMGYLHEGHLSLIRQARKDNDFVVVSIFVNPIQFGPKEDYRRYPRDLRRDLKLCREVGVDLVFVPSVEEMYPRPFLTYVEVKELDRYLCGASRPGHFRGVCTVVAKLFNIVMPDVAYFGQKDIQQARIIQQMVADLNFPIKVKIMPIVREPDGLAMSSRNVYLSEEERRQAPIIYRSLLKGRKDLLAGRQVSRVLKELARDVEQAGGKVDYVELVRWEDMAPVRRLVPGERYVLAMAVWFGRARLIDNVVFKFGERR